MQSEISNLPVVGPHPKFFLSPPGQIARAQILAPVTLQGLPLPTKFDPGDYRRMQIYLAPSLPAGHCPLVSLCTPGALLKLGDPFFLN